jgi:hypothetical protein
MWRERAVFLVTAVLAAAACYEVAVAVRWISLGSEPGDDAAGQGVVTAAVLAAVVAAIVVSLRHPRPWPFALVPVATAAWMTAHYYAFGSYYLPSRIRYSEVSGGVSPVWVYAVLALAVALAVVISRRPRVGAALTPFFVLVCAGTVIAEGIGH